MNPQTIGIVLLVCGGLWFAIQQSGIIDAWRRVSSGERADPVKEKDSSGVENQIELITIHSKILELKGLLGPSHPAQAKLDEVGQMMYTAPLQETSGGQQ